MPDNRKKPILQQWRFFKPTPEDSGQEDLNPQLIETLKGLHKDPALAANLYPQLFQAHFLTLVQDAQAAIEELVFLTYPAKDAIRELPVFTGNKRKMLRRLISQAPDASVFPIKGGQLWPRLLGIIKTGECEVVVDPGEPYTIRLTYQAILDMVRKGGV